jgi:hypothetical protein
MSGAVPSQTHIPYGLNKDNFSRNNQQSAMICTTPLFYILAPTFFGSSLPSSGSFLDPNELHELQIEWVVYLTYITSKRI